MAAADAGPKMVRLGNKVIPADHFTSKRKRSKKARIARALKAQEPKIIEDPKRVLFFRGLRTSEQCAGLMKDLNALMKPHTVMLQRKNPVHPFEDTSSLEFLADKNRAGLFFETTHNKKRPDNIIMGRTFNGAVLDMAEWGLTGYGSMQDVTRLNGAPQPRLPSKALLLFAGDAWVNDPDMARVQNLLQDFFRGRTMQHGLALPALDRAPVYAFTAGEAGTVHMRGYVTVLKKSGTKVPKVELAATGPFADLKLRRTQWASSEVRAEATKVPAQLQRKKTKNVSRNAFGEKMGTVHVGKQKLGELQARKVKALKRTRRGAAVEEDSDGESASSSDGEGAADSGKRRRGL